MSRLVRSNKADSNKQSIVEFLYYRGNLDEALKYLNKLLKENPNGTRNRYLRGDIYRQLGKLDLALPDLDIV